MKQLTINRYQVGLVMKRGIFERAITEGRYWFWRGEEVWVYNTTEPFRVPVAIELLLQDNVLANLLDVADVKEGELALRFENDLLKQVLTAGRYAYWKGLNAVRYVRADITQLEIGDDIPRHLLMHPLLAPFIRSYTIENNEKALLFVDGNYKAMLTGGLYFWWKNNIPLHIARADTRQQQMEINGQEILTRDKAALRINAWARFQVTDMEQALLQNKEYERQLYVALQLALRDYVCAMAFDELLEKKESLTPFILENVRETAVQLGTEVTAFGIRDIILPGEVKDIMNQVLVAEKKAQANTIMRREETASTRSLLNTAKLMEENAMLWKLKEMEYIEKIAEKISNLSLNGNGAVLEQLKSLFSPK
jgi:hypothetical protein